ncbi:tyrosine-protein kinase SRK2 isoform X2 [Eurytemora carolleeae]|uniref:tyrosine-protein kinase SRK2 isoform X2 n=1 Tax=Eurytemora carolleeae TaxID=1294199 RepID=UPI000C75F81A|nr:tyrosine-protein kinase SRK2 isoform X2 [Eurytemora carolleeae]|eukprot:XP_023333461.1 tyrosine-protein kinase SRK2-like isoform X2 [Eurytemora affinis]
MGICQSKDSASVDRIEGFHGDLTSKKKKRRNPNLNSEFHAKQQLTLFIPLKDRIESVTCNPDQIFKLRDDSDEVWWEVSTVDPETHQPVSGYTSRYNFYPKDSERREDQYPWFLGDLSREESEELLHNSANPQGAFLLRFSNNKNQFVLSVKKFNEENSKWEMSHFNIHQAVNKETGKVKLYLKRNEKFSSLEKLLNHYLTEAVDLSPFNLTTICILSNPTSDPAFLRRWELESETDAWQVPREEIELLEELGHGFFGTVNKGIWRNQIPVAVKTLRVDKGSRNNHEREKETFLKETEIMKRLNHPHVVKMFGVCIEKSPFYLIQELCVNGDLLHHLRKFLFLKFPHDKRKDKDENIPRFHTTLVWSLQILKGMEYLESRSLVHRDLAARNVLLDRLFQAKVADFGLTFDRLDEKEEEGKPIIAVYWSAPEAIDKREFSHKSDVWSFGVTMWELVSLADRPYHGLPKEKLKEKLKEGPFLMDPPKNYFRTPQYLMDSVYNLLKDCWERNPRSRPSFKVLQGRVESIIKENIKFKNRTKRNAWNEKTDKMKSRISIADRLPEPSFNYTGSTATAYDYDINKYERHK